MREVTLYTTPTCGYCKMTKEFFKANNISYVEKNVAADPKLAEEMIERTGQMGVPVTIIKEAAGKETLIVGFDRHRLSATLGGSPEP